jgi:hypothetical protein
MKRDHKSYMIAFFSLSIIFILTSCSGGGGGGSTTGSPLIYAEIDSFPTGSTPPGVNTDAGAAVYDTSGARITTATVIVNGVTLTYNPTYKKYEGIVGVAPGGAVDLSVTVGGSTYTASATQFTSYPVISAPVSGATWTASIANTVTWSGGTPIASAQAYGLGVLDAADPNGSLIWPLGTDDVLQKVSIGTTSYSIPSNSLTVGNRLVVVAIGTSGVEILNAAPGSRLTVAGFNYVPVTVTSAANAALISIAVTPANTTITDGATQQFSATGTYTDNSKRNLTSQVYWSTSDTSKAQISSTGLATGTGVGSTSITAALGSISGSTSITVLAGFAPGVHYPDPSTSINLGNTAIGDLNGDLRNDVAVLEASGPRILIYYQNVGGTLDSAMTITTDLSLRGIGIGDVNNDGLADMIVSGNTTTTSGPLGRLAVFRQDQTTHTLGAPQEYTISTDNVGPLAIADLNSDALPDVVSAGTGTGSNGVISLLFQGVGGVLGPEVTYTNVPVDVEGELHAADMNNDGRNDIVLQSAYKEMAVIKQVSPGTFSSTPDLFTIQTSYWPYFQSFSLGDLNGDGRIDVVIDDPGNGGYLNIFLQNTSGILTGPTLTTVSFNAQNEVHIADLDGDGLNDLILLSNGNTIQILYQSADHSFQSPITYTLPTQSSGGTSIHQAMSVGDATGDGLLDIVASWSNEGLFVLPRLP